MIIWDQEIQYRLWAKEGELNVWITKLQKKNGVTPSTVGFVRALVYVLNNLERESLSRYSSRYSHSRGFVIFRFDFNDTADWYIGRFLPRFSLLSLFL